MANAREAIISVNETQIALQKATFNKLRKTKCNYTTLKRKPYIELNVQLCYLC